MTGRCFFSQNTINSFLFTAKARMCFVQSITLLKLKKEEFFNYRNFFPCLSKELCNFLAKEKVDEGNSKQEKIKVDAKNQQQVRSVLSQNQEEEETEDSTGNQQQKETEDFQRSRKQEKTVVHARNQQQVAPYAKDHDDAKNQQQVAPNDHAEDPQQVAPNDHAGNQQQKGTEDISQSSTKEGRSQFFKMELDLALSLHPLQDLLLYPTIIRRNPRKSLEESQDRGVEVLG
eukprot:GHVP01018259.1.p1 GENE.GHVP01018259.1~~GHVP01018259.1.p1  ORF type:complete len:231 (-),score=55.65 GHVP01018259.1:206-898(-)